MAILLNEDKLPKLNSTCKTWLVKEIHKFNVMKTHVIKFLLSGLITVNLSVLTCQSQTTDFTYDNAGNRTSRVVYLNKSTPSDEPLPDSTIVQEKMLPYYEEDSKFNETIGEQSITIYPNPTGGAFAVRITNIPEGLIRSMMLFSMTGKEIFRAEDFNELTEINISKQHEGTYILKIILGDSATAWKIVKL